VNAEHATDFLRDLAAGPPQGPWPGCAPSSEFLRSPAAMRVGQLAARDGLTLFHFEHRVHLPLPLDWVPEHDPELAEPPQWVGGVLPEAKYQSFQHDSPLGSFHPGHRAKWSTHELCHALVGFAWRRAWPSCCPWRCTTASTKPS
jgi:hypothetical protein